MSECRAMVRAIGEGAGLEGRSLSASELEHLASCDSCRSALAASDPIALFSMLALDRKEDAFWLGFETRVLAQVREESRLGPRLLAWWARPRLALLTGGVAMIALVALLARTGGIPRAAQDGRAAHAGGDHPQAAAPLGAIDWVAGAARAVLAEEGPGRDGTEPARASAAAALAPPWKETLPLERDAAPPACVETVSSPTAHIISLSIEIAGESRALDPRGRTRQATGAAALPAASDVVLIVDREMEI